MGLRYFSALCAGFGALCATGAAVAQIDGRYDGYACQPQYRSQLIFEVTWPRLDMFEGSCTVTGAVPGRPNAYTTLCDGEGETWVGEVEINVAPNGSLLVEFNRDGQVITYNRCP